MAQRVLGRHRTGPDFVVARSVVIGVLWLWRGLAAAQSLPTEPTEPTDAQAATLNECLRAHTDAQVLRKSGLLIEARERLLRCAQSDCPAIVIDECAGWLPALETSIPTAVFAIVDDRGHDIAEARVRDQRGHVVAKRSDGRAVALNPGAYTLQILAAGYQPRTERVVVRESEKNRIVRVTLTPRPQPSASGTAASAPPRDDSGWFGKPIPTASWVLGATAVASGLVAGVSGLLYLSAKDDFDGTPCPAADAACDERRQQIATRGKAYTTVDWIAGSVAGVSLITAALIYAVAPAPPERAAAQRLRWQASVAPSSATLQLRGKF